MQVLVAWSKHVIPDSLAVLYGTPPRCYGSLQEQTSVAIAALLRSFDQLYNRSYQASDEGEQWVKY
jgi:hypothetical protein